MTAFSPSVVRYVDQRVTMDFKLLANSNVASRMAEWSLVAESIIQVSNSCLVGFSVCGLTTQSAFLINGQIRPLKLPLFWTPTSCSILSTCTPLQRSLHFYSFSYVPLFDHHVVGTAEVRHHCSAIKRRRMHRLNKTQNRVWIICDFCDVWSSQINSYLCLVTVVGRRSGLRLDHPWRATNREPVVKNGTSNSQAMSSLKCWLKLRYDWVKKTILNGPWRNKIFEHFV